MKTRKLNHTRLLQILDYDPGTGVFRWKISNGRRAVAGEIAGSVQADGCRHITVDRKRYLAHRLAWLYVHGVWPQNLIDHKNLDRTDNRIDNLRPATFQQNSCNRDGWGKHGKGVLLRPSGKWRARIRVNGKLISLGDFSSQSEAATAYADAARKHFGEYARS